MYLFHEWSTKVRFTELKKFLQHQLPNRLTCFSLVNTLWISGSNCGNQFRSAKAFAWWTVLINYLFRWYSLRSQYSLVKWVNNRTTIVAEQTMRSRAQTATSKFNLLRVQRRPGWITEGLCGFHEWFLRPWTLNTANTSRHDRPNIRSSNAVLISLVYRNSAGLFGVWGKQGKICRVNLRWQRNGNTLPSTSNGDID